MKKLALLDTTEELVDALHQPPNSAVPLAKGTLYIGSNGFRFDGNIDISRLTRNQVLDALTAVLGVEVKFDQGIIVRGMPIKIDPASSPEVWTGPVTPDEYLRAQRPHVTFSDGTPMTKENP